MKVSRADGADNTACERIVELARLGAVVAGDVMRDVDISHLQRMVLPAS